MARVIRSRRVVISLLTGALAVLGGGGVTLATAAPALSATPTAVPAAATSYAAGSITLGVQSLKDMAAVHLGDAITTYQWMVNKDDTGDPGTAANRDTQHCLPSQAPNGSPSGTDLVNTCAWPSIRATNGWAPVVAQGTQADLDATKSLALDGGKYLISVTADGYKIAGSHFTVNGATQKVTVKMLPTPLPLATIKIQVFNDLAPVDATYEADAEPGLPGFVGSLSDVTGRVSTDYFGNPLCTPYQHNTDGTMMYDTSPTPRPVIDTAKQTGRCTSDSAGVITIPNLGEDRYAALVSPPVGQQNDWAETTTLEGGHDTDIWVQAGDSGLDNEVMKGAEPVPATQFGFVKVGNSLPTTGVTGHVKGHVSAQLPYIAGSGGQPGPAEGIASGAKLGAPIANPWVALSDLNNGDQQVYVGRGAADGTFDIANVPDGSYQLTAWDFDQDYILNSVNVTVDNGQAVDIGLVPLTAWFTHVHGTVFTDTNGNGKQDPGEAGIPNFKLTVRERDNSVMDQGVNTVSTDDQGHYDIRETYPLGKFLILEAFDTRYQTTGVTYQGENDPSPTTVLGGLVDFNFLPIIGIGGSVNWGVQPYAKGDNGGIAGTVTYDTTRNELDPKDAVTESYQPGIPGLTMHLYSPVKCTDPATQTCSGDGYLLSTTDGSYVKGPELDHYATEGWNAPRGCTARLWNGTPMTTTDQQALPDQGPAANKTCLEAPMAGVAMGAGNADPAGATTNVNGNYGFSGMPAGDYIVSVDIPNNDKGPQTPEFKVTSEADVNVFTGDDYVAQEDYKAATHGGGHIAEPPKDSPLPSQPPSQQAGIISSCVGALHTVHVDPAVNPDFLNVGGSPFEGQNRPSCQDKLVTVRAGQTASPNFNLFTPVPVPTHFWGLTLNDLGLSLDRTSANYGEAQGMPYVPVGLYDAFGNLVDTTHTDYNGLYESLEPSTGSYNCPVPAGPCPGMYRFVGNDPGGPGALNPDYNPRYRTIAANFQAWPGLYTVTDEAPTQVASTVLLPDTTPAGITACDLPTSYPQLFAVDKPVINNRTMTSNLQKTVTLNGLHFGTPKGTLTVGGVPTNTLTWSDTTITFYAPTTPGALALSVRTAAGASTVNGLNLQVVTGAGGTLGTVSANPQIYEVGPGKTYTTIQAGVDAAQLGQASKKYALVVVYPNSATSLTPRGEYLENVIVNSRIHVQGVGTGGFQGLTWVPGSIIDGSGFSPDNSIGTSWLNTLAGLSYQGDPAVPDAAVVTFLAPTQDSGPTGAAGTNWRASLDGFQLTGGIQSDTVIAPNAVTGANTTPYGAAGALITQGGGVYVHAGVNGLQLTDNLITGNGGSYGGGIRVGTPYVPGNHNYGVVIAHNQVRDNGGTNLAGGIGLFQGSNGYSVTDNTVCGNHSSEYGGGISAFGYMGSTAANVPNGGAVTTGFGTGAQGGEIRRNRIWFNQSYDEGGGVMVAGELPPTPGALSPGSGPLNIDSNVIEANLGNDDGGGIRLLQVSGSNTKPGNLGRISITNDTVVDNISAHEGGGISLDDALFTDVTNTTVAKNITTATAVTSDGSPAAAGLTTGAVSDPLQVWVNAAFAGTTRVGTVRTGVTWTNNDKLISTRRAGDGSPSSSWLGFGNPTLLNDVFYDNRAGTWAYGVITGIDDATANEWDLQVVDQAAGATAPAKMTLTGSVLGGTGHLDSVNSGGSVQATSDPFATSYAVGVYILTNRANPQFRMASIVTANLDFTTLGNYHLSGTSSPAWGVGQPSVAVRWGDEPTGNNNGIRTVGYTVSAPATDIDAQPRPSAGRYDAGSDQLP